MMLDDMFGMCQWSIHTIVHTCKSEYHPGSSGALEFSGHSAAL